MFLRESVCVFVSAYMCTCICVQVSVYVRGICDSVSVLVYERDGTAVGIACNLNSRFWCLVAVGAHRYAWGSEIKNGRNSPLYVSRGFERRTR